MRAQKILYFLNKIKPQAFAEKRLVFQEALGSEPAAAEAAKPQKSELETRMEAAKSSTEVLKVLEASIEARSLAQDAIAAELTTPSFLEQIFEKMDQETFDKLIDGEPLIEGKPETVIVLGTLAPANLEKFIVKAVEYNQATNILRLISENEIGTEILTDKAIATLIDDLSSNNQKLLEAYQVIITAANINRVIQAIVTATPADKKDTIERLMQVVNEKQLITTLNSKSIVLLLNAGIKTLDLDMEQTISLLGEKDLAQEKKEAKQ